MRGLSVLFVLLSLFVYPEDLKTHGRLATENFYLGKFEEAASHADKLLESEEEKAHGLYLLSAIARAEGAFDEAKALAKEAISLSTGKLLAKALFNFGAAEMEDPRGDLSGAREALEEALSLFACPIDQARCQIRLGKIALLEGDLPRARTGVILSDDERIRSHALYLLAQIEKEDGNRNKAEEAATQALEIAHKLSAQKDIERIQAFLEAL